MAFNWVCPYCGSSTTIANTNATSTAAEINRRSKHKNLGLLVKSISCPNPECEELTIEVELLPANYYQGGGFSSFHKNADPLYAQRLLPEAKVMHLPTDVPEEIRTTYREAVLVAEVSGRAGAAMARRCLQGIVRDFFSIPQNKRGNLGAELSYVKDKIDPDLWNGIVAIREVGDIGAHMDKTVNTVVDVSPEEAKLLIRLIETLFQEWYIARKKKKEHLERLSKIIPEKRKIQKSAKNSDTKDRSSSAALTTKSQNTRPKT